VLNYVSRTDPIRVRFAINERDYMRLSRALSARRQRGNEESPQDSSRGQIELILADGSIHPYRGKIVASDAGMNPKTGTVTLNTVELGPQVGSLVVVESGLEAGQQVAIEGLLSLKEGTTVQAHLVSFEGPAATDSDTRD
jgi:hypothetical protein